MSSINKRNSKSLKKAFIQVDAYNDEELFKDWMLTAKTF